MPAPLGLLLMLILKMIRQDEAINSLCALAEAQERLFLMRLALAGNNVERARLWDDNQDIVANLTYYSDQSKYEGGN